MKPGTEPRLAVDTGGTFTDFLVEEGDRIRTLKIPSTPKDPAGAVLEGVERLLGEASPRRLVHGTTVATNALLERKGGRTALLTTRGFEDLIAIGRQDRRNLYSLEPRGVEPVVPASERIGIDERTRADGTVARAPSPEQLDDVLGELRRRGIEAVAVGFLHAWINPSNEVRVAERLRQGGLACCASHELLREYREVERFSTTAVNAYLLPPMARYLERLEERWGSDPVRIMLSGGGTATVARARRQPVHALLSGPAGGVVGAYRSARRSGRDRVLTLDMGGTSTDVSLCPGRIHRRRALDFQGMPLRTGVLDIHAVGAGGGSLAWADAGGALRVGPESSGADPGPCCYGRGGTRPTVTDANLVLGILDSARPLADRLPLQREPAVEALQTLADTLGLSLDEACLGIRRVANANMVRALRVMTVERGIDPRPYTLVAFGGAGPLHAADLAGILSIEEVLVPADPGVLSARGMLDARPLVRRDRTLLLPLDETCPEPLADVRAEMEAEVRRELEGEGVDPSRVEVDVRWDLRYEGQSWELELTSGPHLRQRFDRLHQERYGSADPEAPVEVAAVHVTGTWHTRESPEEPTPSGPPDSSPAVIGEGEVVVGGVDGPLKATALRYDRHGLRPGMCLEGPAVVHEETATTWVPPDWRLEVDGRFALRLRRGGGA